MEDRRIPIEQNGYGDLMKSLGVPQPEAPSVMFDLPAFTLIGASTLSGLVSAPLRSRFVQTLTLEPYTDTDLQAIAMAAGRAMSLDLSENAAAEVERRSRSCARVAGQNVRWLTEYCAACGCEADPGAVREAFALKDVDENGLTRTDRAYLEALVRAKRPVGVSTLAIALGEDEATVTRSIEPFLFQRGYIRKGSRGRTAEQKAFDLVLGRRRVAS